MNIETMLSFLDTHSGALTVVASVVLAIITLIYVVLTWKLVRLNNEMLKKYTQPHIVVSVQPREEWLNWLELVVENKGPGAAYDVKFEVTGDIEMAKERYLSQLGFIKNGIPYFAPGQRIKTFLTDMAKNPEEKMKQRLEFKIKYRTEYNEIQEQKYVIDFSIFEGILQAGEPPTYKIAKTLEDIKFQLLHMLGSLEELKTSLKDSKTDGEVS